MNNTRLFGRVGMTLSSVLVLLHIATLAQAKVKAPKDCPDKDKAIPIGVPIDFCRVAHLTPMLLQRASEPGTCIGAGVWFGLTTGPDRQQSRLPVLL